MDCEDIRSRLGQFFDSELEPGLRDGVERHLPNCTACRTELDAIESMARGLAAPPNATVPDDLWNSIEKRLDAETSPTQPSAMTAHTVAPTRWRPLASAAAIVFVVGLAYLTTILPGTSQTAQAKSFDFAPLLNRVGDDLGAGLQALIDAYGGREITLEQAAKEMKIRVHPPDILPGGMTLVSTHMVNMLNHESLAFHFVGPNDQLLVMQCPAGMMKEYGNRECLACQVDQRPGQVVREGAWSLFHVESENVCICIVSTMDQETELPELMRALQIEY